MLNQFIVLGSIKQKFDNQILLQTNEHGNLRLTGKDVFDDLIDGNVYGFKGHIETDKDGIQLVVEKTTSIDSDDMEKFRDLSSTILVGKRIEASGNTWTLELINDKRQSSRVNVFGKDSFMDEINKQIQDNADIVGIKGTILEENGTNQIEIEKVSVLTARQDFRHDQESIQEQEGVGDAIIQES